MSRLTYPTLFLSRSVRERLKAERDMIVAELPRIYVNDIGPHNLRSLYNACVYVNEAGEVCILTHGDRLFGFLCAKPDAFVGDQAPFAG